MDNVENAVFQKSEDEVVQAIPLEVGMNIYYFRVEDAVKDAKAMEDNGAKIKIHTFPEGFCKAAIEILELPQVEP